MDWKKMALEQAALIERLRLRIAELEAEIARLKKHSGNSSKPPSSDIVKPPKQQDRRRKRKIGAQKGHKQNLRTPFAEEQIDKTVELKLESCPKCGGKLQTTKEPPKKHQQIELVENLSSLADRSKLDKISANLGSVFAGYVRRAGLTPPPKILNNLRASMETDLLSGKYGTISIATIADWLGHSPKVMLAHYKRVREVDFTQVTQHKSLRTPPTNERNQVGSHFGSTKPPVFCESPDKTSVDSEKKLAVYLTVHSPEQGGIGGNGVESPSFMNSHHVLENKAHDGNNRQEMEPCRISQNCQNGEDRIFCTRRKLFYCKHF
jgi:hypothetical protein